MKATLCFSVVFWLSVSCADRSGKSKSDDISGIYTREHSYTIKHTETGAEIGMRTIRDTIFVESEGDKYKVSNRKWMTNDYDNEGWRSMEHSDDRPFRSFESEYNATTHSLTESSNSSSIIYIDGVAHRASKDQSFIDYYKKE